MKRWLGILLLLGATLIGGCGVSDAPSDPANSVRAYAYPLTNGLQYRYARFTTNLVTSSYDTATYQLTVGLSAFDTSTISKIGGKGDTLYRFIFSTDPRTNMPAMVLSSDQQPMFALEGTLADSSSWKATLYITATVFAHYDEYVPNPPAAESFHDVLVVKYHSAGDPSDTYTLRFFARDYGLILEKHIIGNATVIGTLQLVAVGSKLQ